MDGRLDFTATSGTTYATYQKLPIEKTGQQWPKPQNLRLTCVGTMSTGTPSSTNNLRMAIYNKGTGVIKGYWDATITWGTVASGDTGGYFGVVAFAESGTSFFDLLGAPGGGDGAGTPGQGDYWVMGITDAFQANLSNIAIHFGFAGWPHGI
jgi:hypothetical protein